MKLSLTFRHGKRGRTACFFVAAIKRCVTSLTNAHTLQVSGGLFGRSTAELMLSL